MLATRKEWGGASGYHSSHHMGWRGKGPPPRLPASTVVCINWGGGESRSRFLFWSDARQYKDQKNHDEVTDVVGKENSSWEQRVCTHRVEFLNEAPTLRQWPSGLQHSVPVVLLTALCLCRALGCPSLAFEILPPR